MPTKRVVVKPNSVVDFQSSSNAAHSASQYLPKNRREVDLLQLAKCGQTVVVVVDRPVWGRLVFSSRAIRGGDRRPASPVGADCFLASMALTAIQERRGLGFEPGNSKLRARTRAASCLMPPGVNSIEAATRSTFRCLEWRCIGPREYLTTRRCMHQAALLHAQETLWRKLRAFDLFLTPFALVCTR